jgi:hypothetical protein
MQNLFKMILVGSSLILLSACTGVGQEQNPVQVARTYSAVSFTDPGFTPEPGSSFAWYGSPVWSDNGEWDSQGIFGRAFQRSVSLRLQSRGYNVVYGLSEADYLVGVAMILPGGTRSDDIRDYFRMFPQLPESSSGFDRGQIIVGVVPAHRVAEIEAGSPPNRRALLWRSAIEAYVLDLDPGSDESQQRIEGLSGILLESLP